MNSVLCLLLSGVLTNMWLIEASEGKPEQQEGADECQQVQPAAAGASVAKLVREFNKASRNSTPPTRIPGLYEVTVCVWVRHSITSLSVTAQCNYINYSTRDSPGRGGRVGLFTTFKPNKHGPDHETAGMFINRVTILSNKGDDSRWSFHDDEWHSLCGTWRSSPPDGRIYHDGVVVTLSQTASTGTLASPIEEGGTLELFPISPGGVDINRSSDCKGYVGSIDMWNYYIDPTCIMRATACSASGNVLHIDWKDRLTPTTESKTSGGKTPWTCSVAHPLTTRPSGPSTIEMNSITPGGGNVGLQSSYTYGIVGGIVLLVLLLVAVVMTLVCMRRKRLHKLAQQRAQTNRLGNSDFEQDCPLAERDECGPVQAGYNNNRGNSYTGDISYTKATGDIGDFPYTKAIGDFPRIGKPGVPDTQLYTAVIRPNKNDYNGEAAFVGNELYGTSCEMNHGATGTSYELVEVAGQIS